MAYPQQMHQEDQSPRDNHGHSNCTTERSQPVRVRSRRARHVPIGQIDANPMDHSLHRAKAGLGKAMSSLTIDVTPANVADMIPAWDMD